MNVPPAYAPDHRMTMKAVCYRAYGPPEVLKVEDVETPVVGAGDVLIKVKAVSVNFGDLIARRFGKVRPSEFNMPWLFWFLARFTFGWSKPKKRVLGNEFAGEVVAVGTDVQRFKAGDAVFAYTKESMGGYADYVSMPANGMVAMKPVNLSYEQAAAVPYGALSAWPLLSKTTLGPHQRVLVIGASGGIGSAAVQLARNHFGAQVTGVCGTSSVEYVKQLGADQVIDHRKEDYAAGNATYDLIFDVLGKGSFGRLKPLLTPKGVYFSVSFKMKKVLQMIWTGITGGKRVRCALATQGPKDIELIREMVERGKLIPVIDKSYPLEEAAAAHRYAESGNRKGSIVLVP